MGNMAYCRMRNTARDLQDVINHWDALDEYDHEESEARLEIYKLAQEIVALDEPEIIPEESDEEEETEP